MFQEGTGLSDASAVIAAAAHELKTPLTIITYIAHILSDETLQLSAQERLQYLQRLQLVSQRSLRLLQHMTTSYRLETGSQMAFQFALEPVNVQQVAESALHELTPYAKEYNRQLRLVKRRRSPVVVAHRDILHDVIVNLADNALRHSQAGEAVTVSAAIAASRVRLNVHDNGAGMSQSSWRHLRQNLGQSPQPFNGHSATSGLGLYIVQQLVQALGGSLGLARPRQGTTFFVDMVRSQQLRLL